MSGYTLKIASWNDDFQETCAFYASFKAQNDGALSADGNALGTYPHRLFHNGEYRAALLGELAQRKGLIFAPSSRQFSNYEQYDRLAAHVRGSLDMELIRHIIEGN